MEQNSANKQLKSSMDLLKVFTILLDGEPNSQQEVPWGGMQILLNQSDNLLQNACAELPQNGNSSNGYASPRAYDSAQLLKILSRLTDVLSKKSKQDSEVPWEGLRQTVNLAYDSISSLTEELQDLPVVEFEASEIEQEALDKEIVGDDAWADSQIEQVVDNGKRIPGWQENSPLTKSKSKSGISNFITGRSV